MCGGISGVAWRIFGVLLALYVPYVACGENRRWTSRDSVLVEYITGGPADEDMVSVSPDEGRLFFVTERDEIRTNCASKTLRIFSFERLDRLLSDDRNSVLPSADTELTRTSCGHRALSISYPRWTDDSRSVVFYGLDNSGQIQLYRVDALSNVTTTLTREPVGITMFTSTVKDTTIYHRVVSRLNKEPETGLKFVGRTRGRLDFLDKQSPDLEQVLAAYQDSEPLNLPVTPDQAQTWISPDGRLGVIMAKPESIPAYWQMYGPAGYARVTDASEEVKDSLRQFSLVNFESRVILPILDAPIGVANTRREADGAADARASVRWASDSKRLILVNTYIPAATMGRAGGVRPYVAAFDVSDGAWRAVVPMSGTIRRGAITERYRVADVKWIDNDRRIVVRIVSDQHEFVDWQFGLYQGVWRRESLRATTVAAVGVPANHPRPIVTLRQDMNEAPVVVARDSVSGRELRLTPTSAALAHVQRVDAVQLSWNDPSGASVSGSLTLPSLRVGDSPAPLVLQAYYYSPQLFLPDGSVPVAHATQSLVARGMAVLEFAFTDLEMGSPSERPLFVQRIDAAVKAVAAQKGQLVDTSRVGLVGFSRGGYLALYAATHPGKTPLAAVLMADSFVGGFPGYTTDMARNSPPETYESNYGGSFWHSRDAWLSQDSMFNIDRMQAAIFITLHTRQDYLENIPTETLALLGALKVTGRQFDFATFPAGRHILGRPSDRLASLELTADWMSFWLDGFVDPAPEKFMQYERWRKIRTGAH